MIMDSAAPAYREVTGHTFQRTRIYLAMARDVRVLLFKQKPVPGTPFGAQCPSCFTFNLLGQLPENRKISKADGLELKCALCGTRYPLQEQAP